MLEFAILILTFAGAIGSGLVAGIFFAFSSFVMAALGRLPSTSGIAAMQAINVTVINPVFLGLFMGTGMVCLALAGGGLVWLGQSGGKLILVASLLYVVGCVGVTMVFNVPLNNELATARPDAAALWLRYRRVWTAWNHVRTVASLLSALLFTAALVDWP